MDYGKLDPERCFHEMSVYDPLVSLSSWNSGAIWPDKRGHDTCLDNIELGLVVKEIEAHR